MTYRRLDEGRVLLTGATGFVGQAVLERLLAEHPGIQIVALVRGRGQRSAPDRVRQLLTKPVFRRWRDQVGADGVEQALRERIVPIEADISEDVPDLPGDLRAAVHCASTVSFDPPIDEAFRTNVTGSVNLYEGLARAGGTPHVVHVSTAYVAGARKGVVPEATLDHDVDWRYELEAAFAARDSVELGSRRPEVLRRALAEARRQHRKSGPQEVARNAESRRREMVHERLVDHGRLRAQSLGWPDVYTLTKALGERAAEHNLAGLPLSIVRPAIIESALRAPYPGWIDGFKMADPIILAYGRGILPEFPGLADGIVDIVPVDFVANALLAVAATPAEPGHPAYYHVGSGARNPLTFARLYELVREYFELHPLPDDGGRGAVKVPEWNFPGGRRVELALRAAERLAGAAEQTLLHLPATGRTRDWMSRLHREQSKLGFLRRYADLYGVYTEAEVIYTDRRTLALHETVQRAPSADARAGFDTAEIDWDHYLKEVHCPSVTASLRSVRPPSGRVRSALALPEGSDIAAIFDLEGTILASNVVEAYLWTRLLDLPRTRWPGELASVARSLPGYLLTERHGRGDFLRAFLRRYEGADEVELRRFVNERLAGQLLRRAWPAAIRRVRKHRTAGHRTVLVTGAVDVLIEPLRTLFDEVAASRLHVVDGRCTGHLDRPPLVGEARAAWLRRWAGDQGIDLARSFAYGDHYSDRSFLEAVGNPVAVNPDPRLYRHAKRARWSIEEWDDHVRDPVGALLEAAGGEVHR